MAFANAEEFWEVQNRLEEIELSNAMGQDTPEQDEEYERLYKELVEGGWTINMDTHQAEPVGASDGK